MTPSNPHFLLGAWHSALSTPTKTLMVFLSPRPQYHLPPADLDSFCSPWFRQYSFAELNPSKKNTDLTELWILMILIWYEWIWKNHMSNHQNHIQVHWKYLPTLPGSSPSTLPSKLHLEQRLVHPLQQVDEAHVWGHTLRPPRGPRLLPSLPHIPTLMRRNA